MSGVNIEYKGSSIATIPDTGSKTIKTQGKYCEGDILVEYEAPHPSPSAIIDGSLTTYTDDTVTSLRRAAFYFYTSLQSVSFENVVTTGFEVFYGCTYLTTVNMPNVETIGASCFNVCSRLNNVYIPKAITIGNAVFSNCPALTRLELPNVESIGNQVFLNDIGLTAVILGKRATLSSSGSMPANLIFYVQPDDFAWYQTATNWSDLYGQGKVKSVEDLPT